jgi:hypothetical protein
MTNSGQLALRQPALAKPGFQVTLVKTFGTVHTIEASTNLINWTPLQTNVDASNLWTFTDPAATNLPRRFYRAVSPLH